ncbi:hypothetical protein HY025_06080 [Candidatus Daviesbacteria bacterium]|nr:hypothetical protein [Candidatus Daviesbacteria bacterium]
MAAESLKFHDYPKLRVIEPIQPTTSLNGALRQKTLGTRQRVVSLLAENIPYFSGAQGANRLSDACGWGTLAATALSTSLNLTQGKIPHLAKTGLIFSTLGPALAIDALDGELARKFRNKYREEKLSANGELKPHDEEFLKQHEIAGAIRDNGWDRELEAAMAGARLWVALDKMSKAKGALKIYYGFGAAAAAISMIVRPKTSLARAEAEKVYKIVPETEAGAARLGNREGAAMVAIIAHALPEVQPLLDAVCAGSSLISSKHRMEIVRVGQAVDLERLTPAERRKMEIKRQIAPTKIADARFYQSLGLLGAVGVPATYFIISRFRR